MDNSKQPAFDDHTRRLIRYKAHQLIGNHGFSRDDYDDLEQDLTLDLLQRMRKYDPNKATYNTFVSRVIQRKIANLIRHRTQEKRDYRREVVSLNDMIDDGDGGTVEFAQAISADPAERRIGQNRRTEADRRELRMDVQTVIDRLSPMRRRLAELLMTNCVAEAARELGIPRSTLYGSDIARLQELFEDKGLSDYL